MRGAWASVLLVGAAAAAAQEPPKVAKIAWHETRDYDRALTEAARCGQPVLLFFYATW